MKKRSLLCVCASAITVSGFIAVPAAAQKNNEKTTEITFNVGGRYDSNVSRSSDQISALRGLQKEDFVITPSVSLDVVRPFGRSNIYVRGSLGYNFHANNSTLDRENIALQAGGTLDAGLCRLAPEIGLQRRQSDLGDVALATGGITNIPAFVRNTETVQRYGAELSCGRNFGLQPVFGVAHESADNSNVLRERAEYNSLEYTTGLRYAHPTQGTVTAFVSSRDVDLTGLILADGSPDGYRTTDVGLRYERSIGTRLQVNASVAHSKLESRNPLVANSSGLVWNLGAQLLVSERLKVSASTGREIANELTSDATFNVTKPYNFRLEYAASNRLQFDGGLSITDRRFDYGFVPVGDFIERDTRRVYDIGATLRAGERLRFRLFAGHEERDANNQIFDYSSVFAGISVGFVL